MAKTAKVAAKNVVVLIRVIGFVLILVLLTPIVKTYRFFAKFVSFNGWNKPQRVQWEGGQSDPLFAPLSEIQLIKPVRADIPPH